MWGPLLRCAVTGEYECELHHLLGRGETLGIKKSDPRRAWLSSPYNSLPLAHRHHAGPDRDKTPVRHYLLDLSAAAVQKAIDEGFYEVNDNDRAFLSLAAAWRIKHPA